jgi:hypothetical protein
LKPLAQDKVFRSFLRKLFRQDWVVYAKPPFGGRDISFIICLATRIGSPSSNHRLVSFDDGKVTFCWKDYAHGSKHRLMTLTARERFGFVVHLEGFTPHYQVHNFDSQEAAHRWMDPWQECVWEEPDESSGDCILAEPG